MRQPARELCLLALVGVLAACTAEAAPDADAPSTTLGSALASPTDDWTPPELTLTGVLDSPVPLAPEAWCSTGRSNQLSQDCESRSITVPKVQMYAGAELKPSFPWEPAQLTFIIYAADETVLTAGSVSLPSTTGWIPKLAPGSYNAEINVRWNDASDAGFPFQLDVVER